MDRQYALSKLDGFKYPIQRRLVSDNSLVASAGKSTQQYSADGWAGGKSQSWFYSVLALLGLEGRTQLIPRATEHTLGLSSTVVSEWTFYRQPTSSFIPKNLEEAACMFMML